MNINGIGVVNHTVAAYKNWTKVHVLLCIEYSIAKIKDHLNASIDFILLMMNKSIISQIGIHFKT